MLLERSVGPGRPAKGAVGARKLERLAGGTFKVRAQALSDDRNPSGDFEIQD